ncbi:MAG: hypothetical protein IT371_11480 [Deltaproteobacteria bacterium]|nr:hypothetical protein [Deltaproteobacteria bacterium]
MGESPHDAGSSYPQLKVEHSEGETLVVAQIDKPADFAYRLFCDVDAIPKWLWVVGTAVVRRRDARGRALEVDFLGSLERASVAYTLCYTYNDAVQEVHWHTKASGAVRKLRGAARFTPSGDNACVLRYKLSTELTTSLPPWGDHMYRVRPAETVVLDFCEWLAQEWAKQDEKITTKFSKRDTWDDEADRITPPLTPILPCDTDEDVVSVSAAVSATPEANDEPTTRGPAPGAPGDEELDPD